MRAWSRVPEAPRALTSSPDRVRLLSNARSGQMVEFTRRARPLALVQVLNVCRLAHMGDEPDGPASDPGGR